MVEGVVIIGGGPAGSTLGCYLSRAGISNCIIESAVHPRPHVGESMVTSTTRVFQEIGFLETMEKEGFIRKYGASWHPPTRKGTLHVTFAEIPQQGIDQNYTYHVDRGKFDMLLLKHAERLGSRVYQGVRVKQVLFDGDVAKGVRVTIAEQDIDIPARLVVDASGRHTVLGSQLGLKQNDPDFNQFAVHAWFENVNRGDRPDYIHIYFLPTKRGWAWQIPITATVTSVGVVADREVFRAGKGDHQGWFHKLVNSSPEISKAMRDARQLNEFKVEADYSYNMKSVVGNGWLLLGDAARFVDPIFSSGVNIAMHSAKFAGEQIAAGLSVGDVSRTTLLPYQARLTKGTAIWYEFIRMYYKLQSLFTIFIAKKDYRAQVLELLQGEVYERSEVPVLDAMREFIECIERSEDHLLRHYLDGAAPDGAVVPPREIV